ncbi:NAD(P)-binding protein [Suillus decipiens]|nr:NAD(P)-binding protein [Suillus decipiens]
MYDVARGQLYSGPYHQYTHNNYSLAAKAGCPSIVIHATRHGRSLTIVLPALVTGGGTGIGRTIASALVQNGAKVYIAARKESQLKETVADLNAKGPGSADYIVANLSICKSGTDALISALEVREPAKKLRILVNNSGVTWGSPFENFPEDEGWDNVMAVNVKSLFYREWLSTWLAKDASALDPARVIKISSVSSVTPHAEGLVSADGNGTWSCASPCYAKEILTTPMMSS